MLYQFLLYNEANQLYVYIYPLSLEPYSHPISPIIQLSIKKQSSQKRKKKKNCRRPKQVFIQRRHTDGQEEHEQMCNITNYQRNANQISDKVSPHTSQNDHHQKNLQIVNVGEDVKRKEPSYTVGGDVNYVQPLRRTVWRFLKKIKIELPYDPAILLLGMYPEETII